MGEIKRTYCDCESRERENEAFSEAERSSRFLSEGKGRGRAYRSRSARSLVASRASPATRRQRRTWRRRRRRRCRRKGDGSESCHFDRHFSAEEWLCRIRTSRPVRADDAPQWMRLAWPVSPSPYFQHSRVLCDPSPSSAFLPPSGTGKRALKSKSKGSAVHYYVHANALLRARYDVKK